MELTTEQKIETKKFAIEMATRVASLSYPGRVISVDASKLPTTFDLEEFEKLFNNQAPFFQSTESPREYTLMHQIKTDAQTIFDWITQEEVKMLKKGIHY